MPNEKELLKKARVPLEALTGVGKATPHEDLMKILMNSNVPKNELEHAAAREIKRLRKLLEEPKACLMLIITTDKHELGVRITSEDNPGIDGNYRWAVLDKAWGESYSEARGELIYRVENLPMNMWIRELPGWAECKKF